MEPTPNKVPKRYPPEVKERAVRMVLELKAQDPADHTITSRIARHVGVGAESLRNWVKRLRSTAVPVLAPPLPNWPKTRR
jgi:transposase-like protein